MEFKSFSEIKNIGKLKMYVTQKIHGTNAQVYIWDTGNGQLDLKVGSRTRWITPEADNYGFATFIYANKEAFLKLGPGHHYGEWAGPGINSGEGLSQKTFVLFDFYKYDKDSLPPQTTTVPVLYGGRLDFAQIDACMNQLKTEGSKLVPGFMRPEGVVITVDSTRYKKVFEAEETAWQYPENKIIVNYGSRRELVLLGILGTVSGNDFSNMLNIISADTGLPMAPVHQLSALEAFNKKRVIPKNEEGWVVWFPSARFRVKIKGDEYLKIAKLLAELSPISLWENFKEDGTIDSTALAQIPEEYRNEWEPIKEQLETQYATIETQIKEDIRAMKLYLKLDSLESLTPEIRREIGLYIKNNTLFTMYPGGIFPYLTGKKHKYIHNLIRPTGNVLKGG